MRNSEILEIKEIEMCGKKVIVEMKKIVHPTFSYLRPFARLPASESQSSAYWKRAFLDAEKELVESKQREKELRKELENQIAKASLGEELSK